MSLSNLTLQRAAAVVATALIATVVTQILYMIFLGGPQPADPSAGLTNADIARYFTDRIVEVRIVWTTEAFAFLAITLGALVALPDARHRLGWAALAIAGIFNLVQIGIGLSVFAPVALAGEEYTWLFWTVVMGAFAFYFVAKMAIGVAAVAIGFDMVRRASGTAGRALGGTTCVIGAAALAANIGALAMGMSWLMYAGGLGTLAALFVALVLPAAARDATN